MDKRQTRLQIYLSPSRLRPESPSDAATEGATATERKINPDVAVDVNKKVGASVQLQELLLLLAPEFLWASCQRCWTGGERPPQADSHILQRRLTFLFAEVKFSRDLAKTVCVNDRQERLIAVLIYVDRSFHCASVH